MHAGPKLIHCWSNAGKTLYDWSVFIHYLWSKSTRNWVLVSLKGHHVWKVQFGLLCSCINGGDIYTNGFRSVCMSVCVCVCVCLYVCDGEGQGLIRAFTLNVVNCPVRLSRRCWLDWCPIAKKRGSRGVFVCVCEGEGGWRWGGWFTGQHGQGGQRIPN